MKKLKFLPSLKKRRRYVKFEILSKGKLEKAVFKEKFNSTFLDFFGEIGASEASPKLVQFNEKTKVGIIRCNHKWIQATVACLGLINKIGRARANIKILNISGTLKGLE